MSSTEDPQLPRNNARRHFLGVTAATGAKLAGIAAIASVVTHSPANALGRLWGRGGSGGHGGSGGSGGSNGGSSGGSNGGSSGGAQCFLRGTAILTDCGERLVEELRIGDHVTLPDGSSRPVKWVGRQAYRKNGARWQESVVPVRIARNALGENLPHADLYLSPLHALYLNGALIRVRDLVNGTTIAPVIPADDASVEYYGVLLDTHEAIIAEGAAAESFHLKDGNYESFANFADYTRLYGEPRGVMASFAPVVGEEGGWRHLKALLLLGASPLTGMSDPYAAARKTIDARAREMAA
jgi:Hint domain